MNLVFSNRINRPYVHMRPIQVMWTGLSFDAYSYYYRSYATSMSEFTDIKSNDLSFKLVSR